MKEWGQANKLGNISSWQELGCLEPSFKQRAFALKALVISVTWEFRG